MGTRMFDVYQLLAGMEVKADADQRSLANLLRGLQFTQSILKQPLDPGFSTRAEMIEFDFSTRDTVPRKYRRLGC